MVASGGFWKLLAAAEAKGCERSGILSKGKPRTVWKEHRNNVSSARTYKYLNLSELVSIDSRGLRDSRDLKLLELEWTPHMLEVNWCTFLPFKDPSQHWGVEWWCFVFPFIPRQDGASNPAKHSTMCILPLHIYTCCACQQDHAATNKQKTRIQMQRQYSSPQFRCCN